MKKPKYVSLRKKTAEDERFCQCTAGPSSLPKQTHTLDPGAWVYRTIH